MGLSNQDRRSSCLSTATDITEFSNADSSITTIPVQMSPLEKLVKIQAEAEYHLQHAIMNERSRRWNKVVESYTAMLKLMARPNMPPGFTINDSYIMLLYESFYHLAMAYQCLGRHKEAVKAYTQAMRTVNVHKNGCLAGCSSNSCFQTPVLAKRAFAQAKAGDIKKAFCDIEKAIVLDTRNSDLYCIRALLWNTNKDMEKAVEDLNRALRYNPSHVCALILRGTIDRPFRITLNFLEGLVQTQTKEMKKDHVKATQINPRAASFLDVSDIHSPKLIDFWNRFLWSLNVPRNIMHAELMEGFKQTLDFKETAPKRNGRRASAPLIQINGVLADFDEHDHHSSKINDQPRRCPSPPFKCGTPTGRRNLSSAGRRHSYGEALRTYSGAIAGKIYARKSPTRPQTAAMSDLHSRSRSASPVNANSLPRPPSEASVPITKQHRPSVSFSQTLFTNCQRKGAVSAPPSMVHPPSRASLAPTQPNKRRASLAVLPVTNFRVSVDITALSVKSKSQTSLVNKRSASEYAHKVHGMRVFEPLNVEDAPRMYYKPWTGDKLPVAEISRRPSTGVFRV